MTNNQPIQIRHPIVQHKLGLIRSQDIGLKVFRELVDEISSLLIYEATTHLPTYAKKVPIWSGEHEIQKIKPSKLVLVPIMRAGISMVHGALRVVPGAKINFSGIFRDESTAKPVIYYRNIIQPQENDTAIILDPMLATGGSMSETILLLQNAGYKNILAVCLIAAPEGLKKVYETKPDLALYTAAVDDYLDEHKYIHPGLGDAGDRVYETG